MEAQTSARLKGVPSFAQGLSILVVDNDRDSLANMVSRLEELSFKVTSAELTVVALSMIREQPDRFQLIMVDDNLLDIDMISFIRIVLRLKDMPIILMSSENATRQMITRALQEGACFSFEKPIDAERLKNVWQYVYSKKNLPKIVETSSNGNKGKHVVKATVGVARLNGLCGFKNGDAISGTKKLIIGGIGEQERNKRKYSNEYEQLTGSDKRIEPSFKSNCPTSIGNKSLGKQAQAPGYGNYYPKDVVMASIPDWKQRHVSGHLQNYEAHVQQQPLVGTSVSNLPTAQFVMPASASNFYHGSGSGSNITQNQISQDQLNKPTFSYNATNPGQNPNSFNSFKYNPDFSIGTSSSQNLQNPYNSPTGIVNPNQTQSAPDYSFNLTQSLANLRLKDIRGNESTPDPMDFENYCEWLGIALEQVNNSNLP